MENKVLYVRVPRDIHKEVKQMAAFKYISLEKWIMQAVVEKLEREKKYLLNNKIP